jgi:hypothetical protein
MPTSNYYRNKFLNDFFRNALAKKSSSSTTFTGARTFETGITAPPSDKCLKYDSATMASVTHIFVDKTNIEGADEASELAALSDYIIVVDSSDTTVYQIFQLNSLGVFANYDDLNVTFKYGSATIPTDRVTIGSFSTPWLGLSTVILTNASTSATASEPATADGYARIPIYIGTSYWSVSTVGSTQNQTELTFAMSTDDWGTIKSMFIADDPDRAGGNIDWYYHLDPEITVPINTVVNFEVDSVAVSMT